MCGVGGAKMAVGATVPRLIHSEEEAVDSLIRISPFMGPSLEQRLLPPDTGLPIAPPPLQLLMTPPLPPEPLSDTDPPDSLHVDTFFVP